MPDWDFLKAPKLRTQTTRWLKDSSPQNVPVQKCSQRRTWHHWCRSSAEIPSAWRRLPVVCKHRGPSDLISGSWIPARKQQNHLRLNQEHASPWSFSHSGLTCSSHASSMRAHSHSMGASGPRRNRSASSASRLFPFDSRKRGVSGMKHIRTMSSVGGMEQQMASQRQFMKRPAGEGHTKLTFFFF